MARGFARNTLSRAGDEDWRSLSRDAQWLYDVILRSSDLNTLGVCALRERAWAKAAAETTLDTVSDALSELEGASFIVTDEDTGEVLVRTFLRHDEAWKQPYMMTSLAEVAATIGSSFIAAALLVELPRVPLEILPTNETTRTPNGAQQYVRDCFAAAQETLSRRAPEPSREMPGSRALTLTTTTTSTRLPPAAPKPEPAAAPSAPPEDKPDSRGKRIPSGWKPSETMRAWTLERISQTQAAELLEEFVDYWTARAGADARKTDWNLTWKNRVKSKYPSATVTPLRPAKDLLTCADCGGKLSPNPRKPGDFSSEFGPTCAHSDDGSHHPVSAA